MAEIKPLNMAKGGAMSRFAPKERPKDAKRTMMRIVKIYMKWKGRIFLAVLLTLVTSAIAVLTPYLTGYAFNLFDASSGVVQEAPLVAVVVGLCLIQLGGWLSSTVGSVVMLKVSQRLVYSLRCDLFKKMQRLPLSFYDTHSHGDTMSRLTNDVDNVSSTIAQTTTQLISSLFTVIGSLAVMLVLNLPLTIIVLLSVPLVAMLTTMIVKKSRGYFVKQQRSLGMLNGLIEESILNLKIVKGFNRQESVLKEFSGINEELYESSRMAQNWAGYMMPLMNVINNLIFALVVIVGGLLAVEYGLLVGTVITFLGYAKQFANPLNAIAGMLSTIQSALAGAERVFEILDSSNEAADIKNAASLHNPKGDVSFEDVSFSYSPTAEHAILDKVSFRVTAGETIAIVGQTGAGKTTIVNLLTRFYDPNSGSIKIDGVEITSIKRADLRNCFSVVLQETCLFSGTIMDNIRYAKPSASDAEVIAAAQLSRASEFVEKLPDGYKTLVSGSSDTLSQGQRQLLAIARALLCNSPILILDEATSSVDTKTEKDIQRALISLMEGRTSFLIAHRLSTIRDADRIIVLGEGKILEIGSDAELMAKKGHYYEMVTIQL